VWLRTGEFDSRYAKDMGYELSKMLAIDTMRDPEKAFRKLAFLVKSGAIALAVVDCVADIVTPNEWKEGIGSNNGALAKLMNRVMKVLAKLCRHYGTALVLCNQSRHLPKKFGTDGDFQSYGPGGSVMAQATGVLVDLSTFDEDGPDPLIFARCVVRGQPPRLAQFQRSFDDLAWRLDIPDAASDLEPTGVNGHSVPAADAIPFVVLV
jgi:RecA/RadA recombinase